MPAARRLLEAAQAAAQGERFVWDTPLLRPAEDDKQVPICIACLQRLDCLKSSCNQDRMLSLSPAGLQQSCTLAAVEPF